MPSFACLPAGHSLIHPRYEGFGYDTCATGPSLPPMLFHARGRTAHAVQCSNPRSPQAGHIDPITAPKTLRYLQAVCPSRSPEEMIGISCWARLQFPAVRNACPWSICTRPLLPYAHPIHGQSQRPSHPATPKPSHPHSSQHLPPPPKQPFRLTAPAPGP
jgi:hypothetical protein